MTSRQYGFLLGVLLVWVAWSAGWVVFPAIVAGVLGYGVVRALEGDVDIQGWADRFRSPRGR